MKTPPKYLVWWLTEEDYCGFQPQAGKNPLKIADYIWGEFCDRCGRPGRGRLWVPENIKIEQMTVSENDSRWSDYIEAGGIVIEAKDSPACALWGGRFTTLALDAVSARSIKRRFSAS
jgi:hypothetical protein